MPIITEVAKTIFKIVDDKLLVGSITNAIFEVDVQTLKVNPVPKSNHVWTPILKTDYQKNIRLNTLIK